MNFTAITLKAMGTGSSTAGPFEYLITVMPFIAAYRVI